MARFVHLDAPLQQSGIARLALRAAARLRRGYAAWAQARRLREQDRLLRELACTDSRIMADLIAVSQHAAGEGGNLLLR